MKNKKVLGITGPSAFTENVIDMVENYLDAEPILFSMNNPETINKWGRKVDGIIISGGTDIHPRTYEKNVYNHHNLSRFDHKRDLRELQLIELAAEINKPLLGICRGHQMLGVYYGFDFEVDITNGSLVCHQPKGSIDIPSTEPTHAVDVLDLEEFESFFGKNEDHCKILQKTLKRIPKNDKMWVNSFHHQALNYNATAKSINGIKVFGTSQVGSDRVKEIVELMGNKTTVSVQWHPEWDWKTNDYSRLVLKKFKEML